MPVIFYERQIQMNIYIYSDESGVFDKNHNRYFVFGGLVFLSKESRDIFSRKYAAAEKIVRNRANMNAGDEAKACFLSIQDRGKLYRSTNQVIRFGVVINEINVYSNIFEDKKTKQRYLDYAFKIAVKRCFERLIDEGKINPKEVQNLYFWADEHTTATNGKYELKESLETEFKRGTYSQDYTSFHPPIFPYLNSVQLEFCDSKNKYLIRAADIVANRIYYLAGKEKFEDLRGENMYITYLPTVPRY